jgi:hypothetical protein
MYQRLPGGGSGAFEYVRLYLASDHLLLVSLTLWSESYRRFYFRDIQTITLCKSVRGKLWNLFWSILVWVCLAVGLNLPRPGSVICLTIGGMFLLFLVLNTVRGPTCVCRIQTAVQTRALGSLNRLRAAGKVLARLRPLIEAAQGPLAPDELRRRLEGVRGPGTEGAETSNDGRALGT